MSKGQFADACAAFDASEKLDPTTSTVLNQADCREKNNQIATAWGLFLEAERRARSGTDDASQQMHAVAAERASKLEARLSTLRVNVPREVQVGGLEIRRDNERVEPGAWNKALPIDGGSYRISAHAPGNAEWSTTIVIANEHDAKTIDIPRLQGADLRGKPTEATPVATTAPPTSEPDEAPTQPADRSAKWLPIAIGGGAVALLGGGLAFELVGESTYSRSKTELSPSKQLALWQTANHERDAALGFTIAGVAAAGAAAWLYVHAGRDDSVAIAPIPSKDVVGIVLTGGFR